MIFFIDSVDDHQWYICKRSLWLNNNSSVGQPGKLSAMQSHVSLCCDRNMNDVIFRQHFSRLKWRHLYFYHSTETRKPCCICFINYKCVLGLCVSSVSLYSNTKWKSRKTFFCTLRENDARPMRSCVRYLLFYKYNINVVRVSMIWESPPKL